MPIKAGWADLNFLLTLGQLNILHQEQREINISSLQLIPLLCTDLTCQRWFAFHDHP